MNPATGGIRAVLRLEGLAVLILSITVYASMGGGHGWGLFALLILVPDVSLAGYLGGARTGALIYNVVHTYVLPISLVLAGLHFSRTFSVEVGLIWIAHIGMDRAVGYGLKYASSFHDTHLGVIGRGAGKGSGL